MSVEHSTQTNRESISESIDVEAVNHEFAGLSPLERVKWAYDRFGDDLVLFSSFGPTSPILLKLATEVSPDIRVVNIRHGHETPETYKFTTRYRDRFFLNLSIHDAPRLPIPKEDTAEFEGFKQEIKVKPFKEALSGCQSPAYLSGVMRWQTPHRRDLSFVEDKGSVLAINPILDMTEDDVEEFFLATGLPRNDDYYDPTKGHNQNGECGINTDVVSQL